MVIFKGIFTMFFYRWCNIKALPGANRLIKHLSDHGVPMALASNSPRASIESKISYHQGSFLEILLTITSCFSNNQHSDMP